MKNLNDYDDEVFLFNKIIEIKCIDDLVVRRNEVLKIKQYFKGFSADISPFAEFLNIPVFPHKYFGVFISQGAKIGENCCIFQQVTIGSNLLLDSKSFGYPTIGNNCYIGAGAKIIGNCIIGDNVRIGANAVVYKDVPSNSVVTGATMHVTQKSEKLDNNYYAHDPIKGWAYKRDGKWFRDLADKVLSKLDTLRSGRNI